MGRRKQATGALVRVTLLQPVKAGGQRHEPDAELELPADEAQALLACGAATMHGQGEAPAQAGTDPDAEGIEPIDPANMG